MISCCLPNFLLLLLLLLCSVVCDYCVAQLLVSCPLARLNASHSTSPVSFVLRLSLQMLPSFSHIKCVPLLRLLLLLLLFCCVQRKSKRTRTRELASFIRPETGRPTTCTQIPTLTLRNTHNSSNIRAPNSGNGNNSTIGISGAA